jgi:hypothetical protein
MASLTLSELIQRDPSLAGLRIDLPASSVPAERRARTTVHHLADVGQRVTFLPDASRTPELGDEERQRTYVVKATIGAGEEQFVRLTTLDGLVEVGWFQAKQLAPARAPQPTRTTQQEDDMQTTDTDLEQKAEAFTARVTALSKGRALRDAINLATTQDAEGAEAYRLAGIGAEPADAAPVPMCLSARTGESFDALALRYASEHGVSLRQAAHEVGKARPDMAAAR